MARLRIEIEENEYALHDWWAFVNDEEVGRGENYTTESSAYMEARDAIREARER